MTRGRSQRAAPAVRGSAASRPHRRAALAHEHRWVALLLTLHLALAGWGVLRNSVTFDENFHVPAGVMIAARADFGVSTVNPPLVKALCGAAALAAGARLPADSALAGMQYTAGESFMRVNADRYQRVYVAARLVILILSLLLALLVWRVARRLLGPRAALLALSFYVVAPEALAHAGFATMDLATGLTWLASLYAFWMFARTGRWSWWWRTALAVAAAFLVRLSAVLLGPMLLMVALLVLAQGRARRPTRMWWGLALLVPAVLVGLQLGYLGQTSLDPFAKWTFGSHLFQSLQRAAPWLWLPLPTDYVAGLDRQLVDTQAGIMWTYLLGRATQSRVWYYFPLALLFKWPLGFLGALLASTVRPRSRAARRALFLPAAAALYLAAAMFSVSINVGVRYLFPMLPMLCIWFGTLALPSIPAAGARRGRLWPRIAVACALLQAVETGLSAPWYLSFFNWPSGGPGGGDRLVNDSNVDWGQGLIALREELARRGIQRVHLAYHGTTDPAIYGIDYVPYLGGTPGPESEWLAVSSYYFVGLSQRMMTTRGRTAFVTLHFEALRNTWPAARPADCMYLFKVR